MKTIKALSQKLSNGLMEEEIPFGADAENIDLANGKNVETAIGEIDSKIKTQDSNISSLSSRISTAESNVSKLQNDIVDKAPNKHSSSNLTYGGGTSSSYGHVKLTDSYSESTGTADLSIAASQKAVNAAHSDLKNKIGALDSLSTSTQTNLVSAINEVDKNADTAQSTADTVKSTATQANNTANTNKTNIGTLASLTTDLKNNLVSAINEVDKNADTAQNTANTAKSTADTAQSTANTAKSTADTAKTNIGTLTSLTTDSKSNLVSAINEVDSHANTAQSTANTNKTNIGTLSSLKTSVKTSIVNAINSIHNNILDSLSSVVSNTTSKKIAGALAVKELKNSLESRIADSGWVACSMGNGIRAAEGQAPSVRKIGNVVYLRGSITNGTSWSSHDSFLTIPSGYRPPVSARFIQWGYGTYRYTLSVESSGVCIADHITNNQNGDFKIPTGSTLRINCSWIVN